MISLTKVCKDCSDRYPACWGSCPKYLEARAKHDEIKRAMAESRAANSAITDVQYHGLKLYKKNGGKKR